MKWMGIIHEGGSIPLFGSWIEAPVKGSHRKVGRVSGEAFIEEIEVVLSGTVQEINGWLAAVGGVFAGANDGGWLWLQVDNDDGEGPFLSRIFGVEIGYLGHGSLDKVRGSMGVKLTIRRENFWRGVLRQVPLSNGWGSDSYELKVNGTSDGYNTHEARIKAGDIVGDLPAACELRIKNLTIGQVFDRIEVGFERSMGLDGLDVVIEGENCAAAGWVGVVLDSGSSGGAYALAAWDVASEFELIQWAIDDAVVRKIGGRLVKPILILRDGVTSDDFWVRSGSRHGEVLEKSGWKQIPVGEKMVALPVVHIPASDLGDKLTADGVFSIFCRRDVSGSHSLAIDAVILMPLEGYRYYEGMGSHGLRSGEMLVDDGINGISYSEDDSSGVVEKNLTVVGKGFKLMPAKDQGLFFTFDMADGSWGRNAEVYVQLLYSPYWRNV